MPGARFASKRALAAILLEGLLSRLSFGMITFALPLYARHIGMSFGEIGVLLSVNTGVALVLKPLMGRLADRVGLKRSLLAAIGLRSVVSFLLGLAVAPWELFAIRGAHGVSMSMRTPCADALIAEHGGKKTIASSFAWYQTVKSVAGSTSKALAGVVLTLSAANFSLAFGIAFVISLLPLLVVWGFMKNPNPSASASPAPARDDPAPAPRPRRLMPHAVLGFLISATAEMLGGLFPILATEYAGLNEAQTGFVYALSTLVALVAGPVFGWLSDNVSRTWVLMVRSFANAVSALVYYLAPSFPGFTAGRLFDDVGKAAFRPAWGALMAETANADKRTRTRTMGWMSASDDLGQVVAPVLAGLLWSTWGLGIVLGARVVLALASEAYALALTSRRSVSAGPTSLYIIKEPDPSDGSRPISARYQSKPMNEEKRR